MKLHQLREHYHRRNSPNKSSNLWIAKIGYDSREEIRQKLSIDPYACHVYRCRICGKLHTSSYFPELVDK